MSDNLIIGVDEVGRGSWAGPLVVGAVSLKTTPKTIKDSKLLSKTQRVQVYKEIISSSIICKTGWVWPDEIDEYGLTRATTIAIERAVENVSESYNIVIDGSINYLQYNPRAVNLIKADMTVPEVSAASIVAKVLRDKYMAEQALIYKEYGFDQHVGYGTKLHLQAIKKWGLTPLHRLSYKPITAHI